MNRPTTTAEYQALAQFRFLIRRFLNNSEKAAQSVGLEPQHYVGMLALCGLPSGQEPSIRNLAQRLQLQHHSASELVDRMEKRGLLRRERSGEDRRNVVVSATVRGERLLSRLVSASDRGASRERARSDARSQVGTRCGFSQRRWIVNLPGLGWGAQVLPVFPGRPISSANSESSLPECGSGRVRAPRM